METTTTSREQEALDLADSIQTYQTVAPADQLTAHEWTRRFRSFGFFRATQVGGTLEGESRMLHFVSFADSRPREATTVFRVSDPGRVQRVSWTPSLSIALQYASGGVRSGSVTHETAHLFSATVMPEDVLALLNDNEWIVDPHRLIGVHDHGSISATLPTLALKDVRDEQPLKALMIAKLGPDYPVQMLTLDDPYAIHHHVGESSMSAAPAMIQPTTEGSQHD